MENLEAVAIALIDPLLLITNLCGSLIGLYSFNSKAQMHMKTMLVLNIHNESFSNEP